MRLETRTWGVGSVILVWLLLAVLHIARTPPSAFTHDFKDHVLNTHIIAYEHRLPLPREGWETYQPPLYYLINALLNPNHAWHVLWVRISSAIYGALFLLLV